VVFVPAVPYFHLHLEETDMAKNKMAVYAALLATLLGGVASEAKAAEPWCPSGWSYFCLGFLSCPYDPVAECYAKFAEAGCAAGIVWPASCSFGDHCEYDELKCFNMG
jgi:hypothetical protein